MTSNGALNRSPARNGPGTKRGIVLCILIVWQFCACPWTAGQTIMPGATADPIEFYSITVNGMPALLRRDEVNIGSFAQNVMFRFGPATNSPKQPVRIRWKLEGVDGGWRDRSTFMTLTARFFNDAGNQVGQSIFPVAGESAGWNGSLKSSAMTHRRESVVVPQHASRMWIVISSAGPPEAAGVYVVANLVVTRRPESASPKVIMSFPFDRQPALETNGEPKGWKADGSRPTMAKIVDIGESPSQKALAILDDDVGSHADWRTTMGATPTVSPGDQLLIEWNEMYSIGSGGIETVIYPSLKQGTYQLNVTECDILGNPTGHKHSISVVSPRPYWKTPLFLEVFFVLMLALALSVSRYLVWRRMQREVAHLKQLQALDKERWRIAQDIHDDLGARITEISLACDLSLKRSSVPATAMADFERIYKMSRELVSALYETVWAVNPENDNLDALCGYLCQVVNSLCENAQLPCRLQVSDLPGTVQVSSQTRHNMTMAVKEAVHNVIKHAKASKLHLRVVLENDLLTICIQDDGCGFQYDQRRVGHGLANMKSRLTEIGGDCTIESQPNQGTTIQFTLAITTVRFSF